MEINYICKTVWAGSCAYGFSKFPALLNFIAPLLCDSLWAMKQCGALEMMCVGSSWYVGFLGAAEAGP